MGTYLAMAHRCSGSKISLHLKPLLLPPLIYHPAPLQQQPKRIHGRVLAPQRLRRPLLALEGDGARVLEVRQHVVEEGDSLRAVVDAHEEGERAVEAVEAQVDRDVVQPGEEALGVPLLYIGEWLFVGGTGSREADVSRREGAWDVP